MKEKNLKHREAALRAAYRFGWMDARDSEESPQDWAKRLADAYHRGFKEWHEKNCIIKVYGREVYEDYIYELENPSYERDGLQGPDFPLEYDVFSFYLIKRGLFEIVRGYPIPEKYR